MADPDQAEEFSAGKSSESFVPAIACMVGNFFLSNKKQKKRMYSMEDFAGHDLSWRFPQTLDLTMGGMTSRCSGEPIGAYQNGLTRLRQLFHPEYTPTCHRRICSMASSLDALKPEFSEPAFPTGVATPSLMIPVNGKALQHEARLFANGRILPEGKCRLTPAGGATGGFR